MAASSSACEASAPVCHEPSACVEATTSVKPGSVRGGAPSAGIEPAADPPESIETAVDKLLMLSARADGARRPQGDVACMPLAASASRTRGSAAAVRRQDPAAE